VLEVDRRRPVSVVDLGCGVGHGCVTLAQLDGVSVVGVDKSLDAIKYARKWYSHPNVRYEESDLRDFIPHMDEFDYVVSRNAFEHVADGLNLALATRWRWRLMIDVPYDEPSQANPHHSVYSIREASFSEFKNAELFFQNLDGRIFDARARPQRPNVIICVSSRDGELPVTELVSFPFAPWKPPRVRDRTRLQVERAAVLAGRARRAVRAAWRR
jgi:SAM-dependent methyltransferase